MSVITGHRLPHQFILSGHPAFATDTPPAKATLLLCLPEYLHNRYCPEESQVIERNLRQKP